MLNIPSPSNVASDGVTPAAEMRWPRKIQFREGEHALLHVGGKTFGGEDGEQRAEGHSLLLSEYAEDSVTIFYDHQCCLVEAEPHFPNLIWAGFSFS